VSDYTAQAGATTLYDVTYGRDDVGRIEDLVESLEGQPSSSYHYTYDPAGRLVDITLNGASVASYVYDPNGNRTDRVTPLGTTSATYDAQDRLATYGSTSYTYTDSGELLTKTVGGTLAATYSYDSLGNLRSVVLPSKTVSYTVDGEGHRIWKAVGPLNVEGYLYGDDLRIAARLDGSGGVTARFIYALLRNVPDVMIKGNVTYRILTDYRGSPRLVVNSSTGVVAQRIDYDEFGKVLVDTNPGFQPFGFAGGLYDVDTKLVRFGERDYDAENGRWTAKDPSGFDGGDSNLYGYAGADPINFSDPSGNFADPTGILAGGTAALAAVEAAETVVATAAATATATATAAAGTITAVGAASFGVGFSLGYFLGGPILIDPIFDAIDRANDAERETNERKKYEESKPGRKKQGRENDQKKKKDEKWKQRTPAKEPKRHTPGKTHRKDKRCP
ncbi:MAG: RHS repeat-associated core domain-containing protein, partial [Byssovorax sp.]